MEYLHFTLPLRTQGQGREDTDDSKETMSSWYSGTDTHVNSKKMCHHMQDLHRLKPDGVPVLRERAFMDFNPNQECICGWWPLTQGRVSFLLQSIPVCAGYTVVQVLWPEWSVSTGWNFMILLWTFSFVLDFFCIIDLLVFCFDFLFLWVFLYISGP